MRVLHGPVNVGNQPWELSRAERALGLKSDVVLNYGTWLQYPADKVLSEYSKKTLSSVLKRGVFGLSAPFKYDVLHYYFGRTFMFWDDYGAQIDQENAWLLADLKLARRLGKRTFMTLQGCDIRLAGQSNKINRFTPCSEGRCSAFGVCTAQLDQTRVRMRETILPLMDKVFYLNPELGRYLDTATFLPYMSVDVHSVPPVERDPLRRPRIIHAPSNGGIKGTPLVLSAIERLKERYDFEFVLIENMPHREAMALYRSADLAIDQMLAGWYGGFAVELMSMGIPVAAYIRGEDKSFVPPDMWDDMPIIRISPETVEADLARVLERRKEWPEMGRRSREYALKWHDPLNIARAMKKIYLNPSAPFILHPVKEEI